MQEDNKGIKECRLGVVRIRGDINVHPDIKRTFKLSRLYKKNTCVVLTTKKEHLGMLDRIKDYATWGEINSETAYLLLTKRGRLTKKQPLTDQYLKEKLGINVQEFVTQFMAFKKELKDIPGFKRFFKLKPPVGGFERGGIKKPYSLGGVLGYRKNSINELIKRMI